MNDAVRHRGTRSSDEPRRRRQPTKHARQLPAAELAAAPFEAAVHAAVKHAMPQDVSSTQQGEPSTPRDVCTEDEVGWRWTTPRFASTKPSRWLPSPTNEHNPPGSESKPFDE